MNIEDLKSVDPILAEKIKKDFDLNEIRGHTAEVFQEWAFKALMIEATLFMLRNDLMELVGVTEYPDNYYEPKFQMRIPKEDEEESDDSENDNFESNEIDFE